MNLTGVFAPLPTPFDERDEVDVARLRAAVPRWLASPLRGLVVLGTTGEFGQMSDDECDLVVETARALVPADRPLIVGASRDSTNATIRAARRAAALGADAVLVRTPAFFKSQMTHEPLRRHYLDVADASPVPVLAYNFAAATGVNMLPATVAQIAAHPNIVGMKESGSDISQIGDLVSATPPQFRVLSGSGTTFYAALCAGVSGGILAIANLLPEACVQIYDLVKAQRHDEALAVQRRIIPLARLISTGHGVPGLKAALALSGVDVGLPRRPLLPVSADAQAILKDALLKFEEVVA